MRRRTIAADVIQGIIAGAVLAYIMANLLMNAEIKSMQTTVNGWSTTLKCGQAGNGILLRAACAKDIPAANLPEEAVSWTATVDDMRRAMILLFLQSFQEGDQSLLVFRC